ncbi:MAG: dihydropteroate synthase [Prolixibacteraceae bacterium]|nr:dihydropteroate synthase [Prolixibacteraceae bacterium]MDD4755827.1 dihydropteroate synthase [Prolixibacteraceae bacterium]NLO02842.1 dihydropteroate synthase [Bacteroidales bacterium]
MLITQSAGRFLKRKNSINLGGRLIDFSVPAVMGVLNVTPDSFYEGGKTQDEREMLSMVEEMLIEGADIIDIGAVSTRPGAPVASTKTELERLLPAVVAVRKAFPEIAISIDTFRSWVALRVIEEVGPVIINDISGGTLDPKMYETIAKVQMPYVLCHIQGNPRNMQDDPQYEDVIKDISNFFSDKVKQLTKMGVNDIIIDPGFGFGKNMLHNYDLMNRLDSFKVFQLPVLVGLSRKSMIWRLLSIKPEDALNGTTVLNTMALMGGADILRVHDVKEAAEAITLFEALKSTAK